MCKTPNKCIINYASFHRNPPGGGGSKKIQEAWSIVPDFPSGCRLIDPKNWHFTLAFLDQVDDDNREPLIHLIEQAIENPPKGSFSFNAFETFPGKHPSYLIARAVAAERESWHAFIGRLRDLVSVAAPNIDRKPWVPHVTIARAKKKETTFQMERTLAKRYQFYSARDNIGQEHANAKRLGIYKSLCLQTHPLTFSDSSFVASTQREVVSRIETQTESGKFCWIVTANPEILLEAKRNPRYWETIRNADLRLVDGFGLQLVGWLFGASLKRVTGVDLSEDIIAHAERRNWSVTLLGGRNGVADRAAWQMRQRHPRLRISSYEGGDVSREGIGDDRATEALYRLIHEPPDILLVGFGHPKQEEWIAKNADTIPS